MAIKIGTTDLSTVGKIKLGSTNVTKVYLGTTQIFPVTGYYPFATQYKDSPVGSVDACSGALFNFTLYTTNSNGIVSVGDVVYIEVDGIYYTYNAEGYNYVSYNEGSTRKVLNIDTGTGEILSKSNCGSSSFEYEVKLGNNNAQACSATTETVYSADEFFTTGIILYSDALLTTLVSGNRVVDAVTTDIYNLSSGVVGSVVGAC